MSNLTEKQKLFVNEYLIDLNATRAYKEVYKSVKKDETARANSSRLLKKPNIQAYLDTQMKEREKRTEITQDKVLDMLWNIATANPNEIMSLQRTCCRYCYGKNYNYQWFNENEFEKVSTIAKNENNPAPPNLGGYGFNPKKRPNPKCPHCFGDGYLSTYAHDTRYLGEKEKILYAGVKETQAGVEVKMKDQMKALELIGKHLGMFTDKTEISGDLGLKVVVDYGDDEGS